METIDSLKKRLETEKNPISKLRIENKIKALENANFSAKNVIFENQNNHNNQEHNFSTEDAIVGNIDSKEIQEKKQKLIDDITKNRKLFNLSKDDDYLEEIKNLELQLKEITDSELKLYAYEERIAIMEIDGKVAEQIIQDELKKMSFRTEFDTIGKNGINHHYLPKGMILTEDGFLCGIEAYEYKKMIKEMQNA